MAIIAGYVCTTVDPLAQLCYACSENLPCCFTGYQPHYSEQVRAMQVNLRCAFRIGMGWPNMDIGIELIVYLTTRMALL